MMHRRFWPVFGWPAPPASGPYPAMPMEGFRTELRSLGEAYDCQTLRFVVDEVIAERDRVVLTVHNEGSTPTASPTRWAIASSSHPRRQDRPRHRVRRHPLRLRQPRGWHFEHGDGGRGPRACGQGSGGGCGWRPNLSRARSRVLGQRRRTGARRAASSLMRSTVLCAAGSWTINPSIPASRRSRACPATSSGPPVMNPSWS